MRPHSEFSLFTAQGKRKYLTPAERHSFLEKAQKLSPAERSLCCTLLWTGARLSEVLNLHPHNIDYANGIIAIQTLKKRGKLSVRLVPVPLTILNLLSPLGETNDKIWGWSRTKAWMVVKRTMSEAGLQGAAATPRGLRHTFGVHAVLSGVPITLLQKWMGHSKLETTAIYTNVMGKEERRIAERMWQTP